MCGTHLGNLLEPALAGVPVKENVAQQQISEPMLFRPSQTITCSACQASVSPSFTWCPHCGQALKSHPCAYCGSVLEASEQNCLSCGAPGGKRYVHLMSGFKMKSFTQSGEDF